MLRRSIKIWWAILAIAIAGTATAAAPATAEATVRYACPAIYPRPAYCDEQANAPRLAAANHVGWVYLNLNYCPPGYACAAIYHSSTPAWRWSGTAWSRASLAGGWVYVYPYTGSWRWAWTQQTGWVAVNTGNFRITR